MHKRSLASKYLHFHVPHMVFIYDSCALKEIKKKCMNGSAIAQIKEWELKVLSKLENPKKAVSFDRKYLNFCLKCLYVYLGKRKKDPKFTPRALDNLLLKQKG
jgi:hypothetical protein